MASESTSCESRTALSRIVPASSPLAEEARVFVHSIFNVSFNFSVEEPHAGFSNDLGKVGEDVDDTLTYLAGCRGVPLLHFHLRCSCIRVGIRTIAGRHDSVKIQVKRKAEAC